MTKTEVLALLKENRDARGEANWKAMGTSANDAEVRWCVGWSNQ